MFTAVRSSPDLSLEHQTPQYTEVQGPCQGPASDGTDKLPSAKSESHMLPGTAVISASGWGVAPRGGGRTDDLWHADVVLAVLAPP